jgi:TonB family protein
MVVRLCALLCFLVLCLSLVAHIDEPELISGNIPRYPPLARQAHIEGIVKVTFTLPANAGEPAYVEAASGHPELKAAAVENMKTWHFRNLTQPTANTKPHSGIG